MAHAFQSRFQLAPKINQAWSLSASDAAGLLEQATEEAAADVDPWSDPAVVLIIARLALLAGGFNANPRELIEHCESNVPVRQDPPLLL